MHRIRSGNPIRTFAWHTLESEVAQDQYFPIIPDLHALADHRFGLVAGGQQLIVDDVIPLNKLAVQDDVGLQPALHTPPFTVSVKTDISGWGSLRSFRCRETRTALARNIDREHYQRALPTVI